MDYLENVKDVYSKNEVTLVSFVKKVCFILQQPARMFQNKVESYVVVK